MTQKYSTEVEKSFNKCGRIRNAFITINNYSEEELMILKDYETKYTCIGKHIGSISKIPHIHALLEFKNGVSWKKLKSSLPRSRIESRKGTSKECYAYINKDNMILFEKGKASCQGAFEAVRDACLSGETVKDIASEFPTIYIKHHAGVEKIHKLLSGDDEKERLNKEFEKIIWRPWQKQVMKILEEPVNERKIYWFYDKKGGVGKTKLSRYISLNYSALYLNNAKTKDIVYAIDNQKIMVFDFARSLEENINYGAIETVKNGICFSGKYASNNKIMDRPKVICFANFLPNVYSMSLDRWEIYEIKDDQSTIKIDTLKVGEIRSNKLEMI